MYKLLENVHYNYHYYAITLTYPTFPAPVATSIRSLAALRSQIAGTERA